MHNKTRIAETSNQLEKYIIKQTRKTLKPGDLSGMAHRSSGNRGAESCTRWIRTGACNTSWLKYAGNTSPHSLRRTQTQTKNTVRALCLHTPLQNNPHNWGNGNDESDEHQRRRKFFHGCFAKGGGFGPRGKGGWDPRGGWGVVFHIFSLYNVTGPGVLGRHWVDPS